MKKLISVMTAACMALSFAACTGSDSGSSSDSTASTSGSTSDTTATTEESGAADDTVYTVGICQQMPHEALDSATQGFKDALVEKFGEDGIVFDEQNAQGDSNTCSTIVNGFVSSGYDLIMANGTSALQAAAAGTADIPILGTSVTEYGVALGIDGFTGTVGGNISGTSDLAPLDEQANTGPLIDEAAVARMEQLMEDAVEKGARVACGGTRPADKTSGFYFLPTILTGVMPEMRVFREEVFGPVLALMSYDTEEEAIRMANDTEYGLSSYIWSTDLSQVYRLTRGLQFGIVNVNGPGTGPAVPHGGCKNSGIGKDGSRYSLEEYTYIKGIRMAIS